MRLHPRLEAGIKGKVILTLAYSSTGIWTQYSLRKDAPFLVSDVSTFAGSDYVGAEQHNSLVGALLCQAKILKCRIGAVLGKCYPAIEEIIQSHLSMIVHWVPRTALIPCREGITNKMLLCRQYPVPFCGVYSCIKLQRFHNLAYVKYTVLLLVATIVI